MLYFIIRILINGVAIALTAWLVPGIAVANNSFLGYLLLGAAIGLINASIRPLILFFTGRWVIMTMGLFILVVNGLMLGLLGLLFPTLFVIQNVVSALLGGIIMGVSSALLEAVLGLVKPIVPPAADGSIQTMRSYGLERLGYGSRNRFLENLRIQQIYETFWRYGINIALDNTAVADFRNAVQRRLYGPTAADEALTVPAQVRIMLQELGPIYVKLGQIMSSQSQTLPPNWETELSKLQSNVPPFPSSMMREIVQRELGAPPEELFDNFEEVPFAAASTAQVHRAELPNGHPVVIKVRRPRIVPQVKADLGIIHDVVSMLEKRTTWASEYNLVGMVEEFSANVIRELDYKNEAYNARVLSRNLGTYPNVHVPVIYDDYSTSTILTMEFVEGTKITNVEAIVAAGIDCQELAFSFVSSMVKQILLDGYFHGDPHPGNILVNLEQGTIIYLDMGLMGYLDSTHRLYLADLLFALSTGDALDLARVMLQLSTPFKEVDEDAFCRDMERLLTRYVTFAKEGDRFADVMTATLDILHARGLRLDEDLTIAIKAMIQAETAALALDPQVDIVDIAFTEAKRLFVEQVNYDNVKEQLRKEAVRTAKDVARRIPDLQNATMKWLDEYERGKLTLHVENSNLASQVGQLSLAVRYLAVGFTLAGMLIGSGLAIGLPGSELGTTWPVIAIFLFFASLIISGLVVTRMLWQLWSH